MGYLKSIGSFVIYIGFFLGVITFLPGIPPQAEFSEYSIKTSSDVQIQYELKNRLQGAEFLFSGEIKGPEAFASHNGKLYTGIRGGYVVQVEDDRLIPIVKFGQKCDGLWQEEKCGRPLGLKFNDKGDLFVADSYYGLFKVDVNTRQYVNLVSNSEPIDGAIPKTFNSLDVAKNGDIYWTHSSSEFTLLDGTYTFLANPSGRLIRYNAATKKNEVLLKNLGFANGVQLSEDESFVIALECQTSRIVKYYLKGPKTGKSEYFIEGLPGIPDNVHSDGQGGFIVALISVTDSEHPLLYQSLMPHPYLRKMVARLIYLIETPFKLLQNIYPNYYSERVTYAVGSLDTSVALLDTKKMSTILRIDKTGKILDAIYSEDTKISIISDGYIFNGYLWLGSPWNEHIMRVPLKQAFPDLPSKKSTVTRKQEAEEPLITASATSNVKVEAKPAAASKPMVKREATTKSPPKPAANQEATTQSPPKPVVKQETATQPRSKSPVKQETTTKPPTKPDATTPKPTTSKPATASQSATTITPKPAPATKEVKEDNPKEIKKDATDSQATSQASKKSNKAAVKSESSDSVKARASETQSAKSKSAEKKNDPTKK